MDRVEDREAPLSGRDQVALLESDVLLFHREERCHYATRTHQMALRLSRLCGNSAEYWLNAQRRRCTYVGVRLPFEYHLSVSTSSCPWKAGKRLTPSTRRKGASAPCPGSIRRCASP